MKTIPYINIAQKVFYGENILDQLGAFIALTYFHQLTRPVFTYNIGNLIESELE
jgi:hypothetical protein